LSGDGYELTTAHAFLTQALDIANGTPDLQNPLLTEMQARVDSYTWRPWGLDENSWRRSACISAISFAMRTKPEERVLGAMLQASLSAERGLDLWHHWRGDLTALPQHLEVMENVRRAVYALQGGTSPDMAVDCLFSPLRLNGPGQIDAVDEDGHLFLKWLALDGASIDLQLTCPKGTKFFAGRNIQKVTSAAIGGMTTLHCVPIASGFCEVRVILPDGAPTVPTRAAHLYAEVSR
jgi:hypothetical protein